ncbi:MAG: hypothetical protein ABFR82_15255 [Nitrospirota bacterium]
MKIDIKQFSENLMLYGADVHQWPEDIRQAGLDALENYPDLQKLSADQEHFEKVLKKRKYEEPDSSLEQRIISSALDQKKEADYGQGSFLQELLSELLLPKPALIAVSVLMIFILAIGFAIGFSSSSGPAADWQKQANLREFLYYEGEIL